MRWDGRGKLAQNFAQLPHAVPGVDVDSVFVLCGLTLGQSLFSRRNLR
jgi:hypothetical protein